MLIEQWMLNAVNITRGVKCCQSRIGGTQSIAWSTEEQTCIVAV